MDHILWSQPAAALLTGAPVVQLIRWSQASFPATLPGGVQDSAPLMVPRDIPLTPEIAGYAAEAYEARMKGQIDDIDPETLGSH
nr:nitrous oxide reductase maturation protein [uncultured bacterium]